jgi:hypothetical protein
VVRVGDAAAVTNPFTGEGIAQALDSGEMAAMSVMEELESPGVLAQAYAARMRTAFPQTTRIAENLPWLVSRGAHFVPEFWGAISPPISVVGRTARRLALEEPSPTSVARGEDPVAQAWKRLNVSIGAEFPLLAQFLDTMRDDADVMIVVPLRKFLETSGARPTEDITDLLLLAMTICVLADGTVGTHVELHSATPSEAARWAINAVALGGADVLLARFFVGAARLPAAVSAACNRTLSVALACMCERSLEESRNDTTIVSILWRLADGFSVAAQTSLARAA